MSLLDEEKELIDRDIITFKNLPVEDIIYDNVKIDDDQIKYYRFKYLLCGSRGEKLNECFNKLIFPTIIVKNIRKKECKRTVEYGGKSKTYKSILLGMYFGRPANGPGNPSKTPIPRIELYDNNIRFCANDLAGRDLARDLGVANDTNVYPYLFSTVLLHELMHAIMDSCPREIGYESDWYKSLYGMWKEESYANAGALHFIKDFPYAQDKNFVKFASYFMSQQPDPYKYGLTVYANADFGWEDWKETKKNTDPTTNVEKMTLWLQGLGVI